LCGLLVKVDLSECFSLYTVNLPLRGGVHTSPAFSIKLHPCSVLNELHNDEHYLLRRPRLAGLETLYTSLLILTIE